MAPRRAAFSITVFGPSTLQEPPFRILRRDLDHRGTVEPERGREDARGAVEMNHALHGLLDGVGLGPFLFPDDFDAGHLLDRRGSRRMRLVVAVVVTRA